MKHLNIIFRLSVLVVLLLLRTSVAAQQAAITNPDATHTDRPLKEHGFLLGYSRPLTKPVTYDVVLLGAEFVHPFSKALKNDFVTWYVNPQFNFVKADSTKSTDIEFGINLGIRNYMRMNPNWYIYQMVGSGPHFISARLSRQTRGFIFSNNFALGSLVHISGSHFLNLQSGFRHISNANLKLPNRGINSYVFMIGYSIL
ncbi:MAG: acyloxyacyl hydrolase [Flavisolibacter sp.]